MPEVNYALVREWYSYGRYEKGNDPLWTIGDIIEHIYRYRVIHERYVGEFVNRWTPHVVTGDIIDGLHPSYATSYTRYYWQRDVARALGKRPRCPVCGVKYDGFRSRYWSVANACSWEHHEEQAEKEKRAWKDLREGERLLRKVRRMVAS